MALTAPLITPALCNENSNGNRCEITYKPPKPSFFFRICKSFSYPIIVGRKLYKIIGNRLYTYDGIKYLGKYVELYDFRYEKSIPFVIKD